MMRMMECSCLRFGGEGEGIPAPLWIPASAGMTTCSPLGIKGEALVASPPFGAFLGAHPFVVGWDWFADNVHEEVAAGVAEEFELLS